MRRKGGILCMVLGLVLLLAALSLILYNRWEDSQAGKYADEALEELQWDTEQRSTGVDIPIYNRPEDGVMDTVEIDGRAYIGTLTIPSLELELPILSEWSYEGLRIAPGRYTGSVWTDDLVICGHNYSRHFGNLKYLETGDTLTFTDVNGNVFHYQVAEVIILQPTDVEEMITGEWDLTLFTCTIGGRTRVTVRCSRTDET
ncbi:MAG: sortase [Lachnospiraceae bacterium]|nr:sortase [Lachnospiraceae bacterium]